MYNIDDLNVRLLSELKEIAEELGVKNFKKLPKKELIYKILDFQAANPQTKKATTKKATAKAEPVTEPSITATIAKRENVKEIEPKDIAEKTADELLESFDMELDETIGKFSGEESKTKEKRERPERAERAESKTSTEPRKDQRRDRKDDQ
jgi:transcription termination factor Rho